MPVGAGGEAVRGNAKAVARGQQSNALEEAAGGVGVDEDQGGGEDRFVNALVDAGQGQQAFGLGGESEQAGAVVVAKWALAGVVAGGKEFAAGRRPDGEGEASEKMVEAVLSPAEPGGEQEVGVRELLG